MITEVQTTAYTVERLSATNLADVEKLHEAVYKRQPQSGFFSRKYNSAFTKVEYIGFIAYSIDRIAVGYYGVLPCFIEFKNQIVLAAQSADTMTHPEYRFKGLFVELSNLTFQLCRDNGIQLLFGFPNQNSLPGAINKLGWKMTEQMDCFETSSGTFEWQRIVNKFPVLKKSFNNYQQKKLKKYLIHQRGISNSSVLDGFAGIYRDTNYCNYKTYAQSHVIGLGGCLLWIKIGGELLIGDILLGSGDFDDMMDHLKKLARKLGISRLQFHSSPGTALHKLFSEQFMPIPSFPVLFQCFDDELPIEQIKFTSADIDTF
jgi:hypothetical protein